MAAQLFGLSFLGALDKDKQLGVLATVECIHEGDLFSHIIKCQIFQRHIALNINSISVSSINTIGLCLVKTYMAAQRTLVGH